MKGYNLYLECQTWRPEANKPISLNLHLPGLKTPIRKQTGYRIKVENWDPINKVIYKRKDAQLLNMALERMKAEVESLIIKKQLAGLRITGKELSGHIIPFYDDYAERLGKAMWSTDVNRIHTFCASRKDLPSRPTLAYFDVAFLKDLQAFEIKRGTGVNTISTMFANLLSLLNTAVSEHIILKAQFDDFKLPRTEFGESEFLREDEIERLLAYMRTFQPGDPSREHMAVASMLLGCFSGLRHSDWQTAVNEQDERISETVNGTMFRTITTKTNTPVMIPCGKTLLEIFRHLKGVSITQKTHEWAKMLKRVLILELVNILRHITSHAGRHSFGYWAASQGWNENLLATILGVKVKAVKRYYHLTGENVTKQAVAMSKR